jgi:ribonuclease Z
VRRASFSILGLIVLVAAGWLLFRADLGVRLMRAGIERVLSTDPIAQLGGGLHVVLCGAGGPMPAPERSGPCVAVVAGESLVVFDAGSGAARNLARMRLPPPRVGAVFLTHFHSDHIDGLGELATLRWPASGNTSPLPVFGPEGVRGVVEGLNRAYALDRAYRTAHHGEAIAPPAAGGMLARPFATPGPEEAVEVFEDQGLRVRAFRVDHAPADPAVGYRIDYAGRSVVISGDTARSESLLRNARGADLLVHEALAAEIVGAMREGALAAGNERLARILIDIPDYHTTPVEAAEVAQAAGVRHLLYYHVVPPLLLPGLEAAFLRGVSDAYAGGVTLGRDGTRVTLPSGSDAVEVSSR